MQTPRRRGSRDRPSRGRETHAPRRAAGVLLIATLTLLPQVPAPLAAQAAQAAGSVGGTYVEGGLRLSLGAGGRFRLTANALLHSSGRYLVQGDTVAFREEGRAVVCAPGTEGRYRWALFRGELTLEPVAEACARRAEALGGRAWSLVTDVERLALVGATLVDGTGGPPRSYTTILIADGMIEDVFVDGAKLLPPRVEVIQMRGSYVVPGLIDTHAVLDPGWESRALTRGRLANALHGGVTTMRIYGSADPGALAELRESARSGRLEAPMLVLPALVVGRDTERFLPTEGAEDDGGTAGPVMRAVGHWSALERARGSLARGVQFLQGVDGPRIRSFMAGAEPLGLRGWSDAALPPLRPSDLVHGGIDLLSDASLLLREGGEEDVDRVLRLMAERGAALEPLLSRVGSYRSEATAERAADVTRRAREAGVRVVTGTGFLGEPAVGATPDVRDEMRLLVERAGFSPHEALLAATAWAADALGLGDGIGRVVPGHVANLVVLTRNPLEAVPDRRSVSRVFLEGVPYRLPAAGGSRLP